MSQQVVQARSVRLLALATLAALALLAPSGANAAVINVTTTADELNTGPGCSLREAEVASDTDAAYGGCPAGTFGGDQINLPPGTYNLTRSGLPEDSNVSGDIDIGDSMTFVGSTQDKVIVDGGAIDRVFETLGGVDTGFQNLTIRNGSVGYIDNGGAILNNISTMTLENVTVTGSFVQVNGGAIATYYPLRLNNVTLSGNRANQDAGGLYVTGGAPSEARLNNVTIAANTADSDADANGEGGGLWASDPVLLRNTLIGDNADATPAPGSQSPDCYTPAMVMQSEGYNLIEAPGVSCLFVGGAGPGDITGQDPLLGPLADNGGPVLTHAIAQNSPALNAGSPGGASACLATDARLVARPQQGRCDIGAYERGPNEGGGGGGGGGEGARCAGSRATRVGGPGRDVLRGTPRRDVIATFGGNDVVRAIGGNDLVCTGRGRDTVIGGRGRDTLLGQAGNDLLRGGAARDVLRGGRGRDRLIGGPGRDRLLGGSGRDVQKQ